MIRPAIIRTALGATVLAIALTALRYTIGGWHDDVPNTLAAFGAAGLVGAAAGTYIAFTTIKYGKLRAVMGKR